jgi:hypothetical protein
MSNPRASSTTSWLSSLSVSGNDIKATVASNSGSSRNGSVTVTVDKEGGGTCDKTMSITQQAGEGPTPPEKHTYTLTYTRYEGSVGTGDVLQTYGQVAIKNGLTRDGVAVAESDYQFMVIADVMTCQHVPDINQCTTEQNVDVGESYYYYNEDNTHGTVDLYGEEYVFKRIKIVYKGTTIYDEDVVPCDDDCNVDKNLNFEA